MAKRFVDTTLYDKAWFRKLPPRIKCLWEYIRLKCDNAGVVDFDPELASFQIGEDVSWEDLSYLRDQVDTLGGTKIIILDFIQFQYGTLSEACKPHRPIIDLVKKHKISERVSKGYRKGIETLEEKDKTIQEKEKEKEILDYDYSNDKDEVIVHEPPPNLNPAQIVDLFNSKVAPQSKMQRYCSHSFPPQAVEDFRILIGYPDFSTLEKFESYFARVLESTWLTKKRPRSLLWLMKPDNAFKVISGEYQDYSDDQDLRVNPFGDES